MQKANHYGSILKDKRLNVWTFRVIVDCVHFCGWYVRMFPFEAKIILILMAIVVSRLFSWLLFFSSSLANLPSQREVVDSIVLEKTRFNVVVQSFYSYVKLRVRIQNLIYGLPFFQKRTD